MHTFQFCVIFSDRVRAFRDAWIIGDEFLRDAAQTFTAIKEKTNLEKRPPPFLFEQFNVRINFANTTSLANILSRIVNALITELNENDHLPKYILIVPDKDIVQDMQFNAYGASHILEKMTTWLVNTIASLINRRKHNTYVVKPGAAVPPDEPSLIWVKMLSRPKLESSCRNDIFAMKRKFNYILEETLSGTGNNYILEIESCNTVDEFDRAGDLSQKGKINFWRDIDQKMRKFAKGELSLKPKSLHEQFVTSSHNEWHFPLPKPSHKF